MNIVLIFMTLVAVKLPLIVVGVWLYRVIHDVPEPEISDDGGDFVKAEFDAGPRRRGPHGGVPALGAEARRGDPGHVPSEPKPPVRA